jgi:hypothetical protein
MASARGVVLSVTRRYPCRRAQPSISSTNRVAIPCRRARGSTYTPCTRGIRSLRSPRCGRLSLNQIEPLPKGCPPGSTAKNGINRRARIRSASQRRYARSKSASPSVLPRPSSRSIASRCRIRIWRSRMVPRRTVKGRGEAPTEDLGRRRARTGLSLTPRSPLRRRLSPVREWPLVAAEPKFPRG